MKQKALTEIIHTTIFLLVFGLLLVFPIYQAAAQTVQNPQDGSVGLSGVIPGEAPSEPAVIVSPANGETFGENPILIRGTCLPELLVQIYRNSVFVGSTICMGDGTFELKVDLVNGQNTLVARVFDNLNQPGPDSAAVTVTFSPRDGESVESGFDQEQLILTSNFASRGVDPGDELTWPIGIVGGEPPYAISWDWGDGQTDLYSVIDSGSFEARHTYDISGVYRIIIKATDTNGNAAYMELIAVVNGPAVGGITQQDGNAQTVSPVIERYILWPLYVLGVLVVLAFVIGRRFEKVHENKRYARQFQRQQTSPSFTGLHHPTS